MYIACPCCRGAVAAALLVLSACSPTAVAASQPPDKPAPPAPIALQPASELPQKLERAAVLKVKKATVHLSVARKAGTESQGTGFFVAPGVVLTNAHVLGMLTDSAAAPERITATLNSDEADELQLKATIISVDRASDLALLRVVGDAAKLPAPLALASATSLIELQDVFIFGFPFGQQLGKAITVSKSTVSALRKDEHGSLVEVQVNGGMNPGNSGGPVVDTRGVVIGVAVAVIKGTQINFAIASDVAHMLLNGKVIELDIGEPIVENDQTRLPIKVNGLDPLQQVRSLNLEVWTGAPGKGLPVSWQKPQPRAGDSPRQSQALTFTSGQGQAQVGAPTLAAGQVYWVQPRIVFGNGAEQWGQAQSFLPQTPAMLDRRAAKLQFKWTAEPEDRTLNLNVEHKLYAVRGSEKRGITARSAMTLLERASGQDEGGSVALHLGNCSATLELDGNRRTRPAELITRLRSHWPTFKFYALGGLKSRNDPGLKQLPLAIRDDLQDMYYELCNGFEASCLRVLDKEVQPNEVWASRQPLGLSYEGKSEITDLLLNVTYHGLRQRAGRTEAYLTVAGTTAAQGRQQHTPGKVRGHAFFDLEWGAFTEVKLRIKTELETASGASLNLAKDVLLERSKGNPNKIEMVARASGGPVPNPMPLPGVGKRIHLAPHTLTLQDPPCHFRPGSRAKTIGVQLEAGKRYVIALNQAPGSGIDPYVALADATGRLLAQDDDGGGFPNARLIFTAPRTEVYRIIMTTYKAGETGRMLLLVAEVN